MRQARARLAAIITPRRLVRPKVRRRPPTGGISGADPERARAQEAPLRGRQEAPPPLARAAAGGRMSRAACDEQYVVRPDGYDNEEEQAQHDAMLGDAQMLAALNESDWGEFEQEET